MNETRRAIAFVVAFAMLWALIELMAGGLLRRYSPYQVVWTRYAVHLLLMLAVWGTRSPQRLWRTRRPAWQLSRSLLMFGMPASWIVAMGQGVPAGTVMAVFWLSPLAIVALARALLREPVPAWLWAATALASAGAWLSHSPVPLGAPHELLLPASMGLCFSLYVVMTRSLRDEDVLANLFYTALGVFLVLTPAMGWLWQWPTPRDALVMVGVGAFGFAALWLLDRACAAAPVSLSAPFHFAQIGVFSTVAVLGGRIHLDSPRLAAAGLLLVAVPLIYVWARVGRAAAPATLSVSKES